jgi:hypothetical protein
MSDTEQSSPRIENSSLTDMEKDTLHERVLAYHSASELSGEYAYEKAGEWQEIIAYVNSLLAQPARADSADLFTVVYDPLNTRYELVIPLPSKRIMRKPILNGLIEIYPGFAIDVKQHEVAINQLNDLIAYHHGLLAYVESKK